MLAESFSQILDTLVNLNLFIGQLVNKFGWVSYLILFIVVFCETGLVITPFFARRLTIIRRGSNLRHYKVKFIYSDAMFNCCSIYRRPM